MSLQTYNLRENPFWCKLSNTTMTKRMMIKFNVSVGGWVMTFLFHYILKIIQLQEITLETIFIFLLLLLTRVYVMISCSWHLVIFIVQMWKTVKNQMNIMRIKHTISLQETHNSYWAWCSFWESFSFFSYLYCKKVAITCRPKILSIKFL